MKISVVIPVYNTEKWIESSIRSVINGGYEDLEIIVVNDGSPDNSAAIIDRLAASDSRIIHLKKENGGLPAARQSGIEASTGDYILFVDSDDTIAEGSLKILAECAIAHRSDMVYCDYMLSYDDIAKNSVLIMNPKGYEVSSGLEYLRRRIECYMCMKLFKREVVIGIEQQKSPVCEDLYAMVQVMLKCNNISYIPKPLYFYRQTENSIMRLSRQRTVGQWLQHGLQMRVLLPKIGMPRDIIEIFQFENIHTIYRFIKEGDKNNEFFVSLLRELIRKTFADLKLRSINSPHRLKLALFLLMVKIRYYE